MSPVAIVPSTVAMNGGGPNGIAVPGRDGVGQPAGHDHPSPRPNGRGLPSSLHDDSDVSSAAVELALPSVPTAPPTRHPRPGRDPFPHIDDITSLVIQIEAHQPIRKVVDQCRDCLNTARSMKEFGRPVAALKSYMEAYAIALEVVPKHKEYVSIKAERRKGALAKSYDELLAAIRDMHDDYEKIKQDVIADNERTGVRPTTKRPGSRGGAFSQAHSHAIPPDPPTAGHEDGVHSSSGKQTPSRPPQRPPSRPPSRTSSRTPSPPRTRTSSIRSPSVASTTDINQAPDVLLTRFSRLSVISAASGDTLASRFSKLGGPTPGNVQDPRIKTHPIVPPNNKLSAAAGRVVPQTARPHVSVSTDNLPSLPKIPDAIYSPARGTVSNEAAQLPSSTSRGLFSRTPSSASVASSAAVRATAPPPRRPLSLGAGYTITAKELHAIMSQGFCVLLLDVRPRDQFNDGHIPSSSTVCIEPSVLQRQGISADQIAESNAIAPTREHDDFEARDGFDLVVFYDQSSYMLLPRPAAEQDAALLGLFTALTEYNYGKELSQEPRLLRGGLDAWIDFVGPNGLATTAATLGLKATARPRRRAARTSIVADYVPRPLRPDEIRIWQETLEKDLPSTDQTASLDVARSTEEFLRRYPEVTGHRESMVDPGSRDGGGNAAAYTYGSSHKGDLYTDLPSPPTRPAPALSRPTHGGLVATMSDDAASVANLARMPDNRVMQGVEKYNTGLNNPGNWCYANSTLQALRLAFGFTQDLAQNSWQTAYRVPRKPEESQDPPQLMMKILANLFHWMNTGNFKTMKAQTLMDYSRHMCHKKDSFDAEFGGDDQQDAQEFTIFILTHLHIETNLRRIYECVPKVFEAAKGTPVHVAAQNYWKWYTQANDSLVDRYWTGIDASIIECKNCQNQSFTFNTFNNITLSIPAAESSRGWPKSPELVDLKNCIRHDLGSERLDDYTCDRCRQKGHCRKKIQYARMPDLLCISFKRFTQDLETGAIHKNRQPVTWHFDNVDLGPFCVRPPDGAAAAARAYPGTSTTDPHFVGPFEYECFAIIMHQGSTIGSGHYYSFVRDPAAIPNGGPTRDPSAWLRCNDSWVSPQRIGRGPKNDQSVAVRPSDGGTPYVLYFRRKPVGR